MRCTRSSLQMACLSYGARLRSDDLESNPLFDEALHQRVTHGHGRRHHAVILRELRAIVREAERGLGDHFGGLVVSGIAAAHEGAHALAAAFAEEGDFEPRL